MTELDRKRLLEIDKEIERLMLEKESLNPYANLKAMSNKKFGEEWSENHILENCPCFERRDEKGWDLFSRSLNRTEVKSVRLPCVQITFNQCHPYDCDYFLFVEYDTVEAQANIFLVPAKDFFLFSTSVQHERNDKGNAKCFTLSGSTKKNKALLENYRIENWEKLNAIAGGMVNNG